MIVGLNYEDPSVNLQKSGANVSICISDRRDSLLPIFECNYKECSSMKKAKLFINFMLSLDVQNAFGQSTSNRPIRKDAQTSNGHQL